MRVIDAWVEYVTHVDYIAYVWHREVREPKLRLVILAHGDSRPATQDRCYEILGDGYTDFGSSGTNDRREWTSVRDPAVDPPFPDTVRLVVRRDPACRRLTSR